MIHFQCWPVSVSAPSVTSAQKVQSPPLLQLSNAEYALGITASELTHVVADLFEMYEKGFPRIATPLDCRSIDFMKIGVDDGWRVRVAIHGVKKKEEDSWKVIEDPGPVFLLIRNEDVLKVAFFFREIPVQRGEYQESPYCRWRRMVTALYGVRPITGF